MNLELKNAEKNETLFFNSNSIACCKLKNLTKISCANCLRELRADPTAYEAIKNVSKNEETENRNIVYICSPLRGDIERNQRKACGYCRFVVSKGYIPVATHLLFPQFMDDSNEAERKQAIRMSLELLSRCDGLWCFGEKLSEGMKSELDFAKKYRIDIRYFTDICEEISKDGVAHEQ